jgi:hypothetical protein
MYVATTGRPYVVEISNRIRASRAHFKGFNQGATVTAPPHAQSAAQAIAPS